MGFIIRQRQYTLRRITARSKGVTPDNPLFLRSKSILKLEL